MDEDELQLKVETWRVLNQFTPITPSPLVIGLGGSSNHLQIRSLQQISVTYYSFSWPAPANLVGFCPRVSNCPFSSLS